MAAHGAGPRSATGGAERGRRVACLPMVIGAGWQARRRQGVARRDGQFGPVPETGGGFGATVGATTSRGAGAGLLNRSAALVVEVAETGPDAGPETAVGVLWTAVRAAQEGAERVAHGFAGRARGLGVGVERVGVAVGVAVVVRLGVGVGVSGSAGGAATGGGAG